MRINKFIKNNFLLFIILVFIIFGIWLYNSKPVYILETFETNISQVGDDMIRAGNDKLNSLKNNGANIESIAAMELVLNAAKAANNENLKNLYKINDEVNINTNNIKKIKKKF